jgi:lipoprotein NlpD
MESISLDDIDFATSTKESLLRQNVEEEEKGALFFNNNKNNLVLFFTPISGVITERFNVSTLHYGVDVVAKENSRVASVLSGTIVVSDWNPETGHSIGIQHKDGYLSFYKHNSVLLRSVGDYVKGGEHVAIIGDSGEFSSGSHLHFELWQNGKPVNPENFILF